MGSKGLNAVSASLVTSGIHNALDKESNITYLENILVDDVVYQSALAEGVPFLFNNLKARNVKICNVSRNTSDLLKTYQPRSDSEDIVWGI